MLFLDDILQCSFGIILFLFSVSCQLLMPVHADKMMYSGLPLFCLQILHVGTPTIRQPGNHVCVITEAFKHNIIILGGWFLLDRDDILKTV